MSRVRVVVTGLGTTSPVGGDVDSTWEALLAGRSGVRRLDDSTGRRPAGQDRRPGAGRPSEVLERVKARRLDRSSPARHGRDDRGLARQRPRRPAGVGRSRRRPRRRRDGHRHRRRHDPAQQLRHAAREGAAPGLAARGADADGQRPRRQHQPVRRRPGRGQHARLGVRLRQRGHLARPRPDPARPGRHRGRGRLRGSDPPAADGGVRQHDGAVEVRQRGGRRPDHREPAMGHRPRRLRAR